MALLWRELNPARTLRIQKTSEQRLLAGSTHNSNKELIPFVMHKILWAVAALTLSVSVARAQQSTMAAAEPAPQATEKKVKDPQTRAKKMADKLTKEFKLNSGQSEQVYVALLDQFTQIETLRDAGDAKGKIKIIRAQTDTKLKAILGDENFASYQKRRNEMKEKRQKHAE